MTQRTDTYDDEHWQLVPKKPTDEMLEAIEVMLRAKDAYRELLAAAPTPPVRAQSVSTASATVQVDPSAVPLTLAPYANCKYRECDLPGQCKGEGRCHHPASGDRSAQSVEPVGYINSNWPHEKRQGWGTSLYADFSPMVARLPVYTTPPSAESARTPEIWLLITEGAFGRTAMKATFDPAEGQRWKDAGCTVREYYDPCKSTVANRVDKK